MKKIENFNATLKNLKWIFEYDISDDPIINSGMVSVFQQCFEQSWKMMKEILEEYGYKENATGSPKSILKTAYYAKMIDNEELWLDALESRNLASHIYNFDLAKEIIEKIKNQYYDMFIKLSEEIEKNWN